MRCSIPVSKKMILASSPQLNAQSVCGKSVHGALVGDDLLHKHKNKHFASRCHPILWIDTRIGASPTFARARTKQLRQCFHIGVMALIVAKTKWSLTSITAGLTVVDPTTKPSLRRAQDKSMDARHKLCSLRLQMDRFMRLPACDCWWLSVSYQYSLPTHQCARSNARRGSRQTLARRSQVFVRRGLPVVQTSSPSSHRPWSRHLRRRR